MKDFLFKHIYKITLGLLAVTALMGLVEVLADLTLDQGLGLALILYAVLTYLNLKDMRGTLSENIRLKRALVESTSEGSDKASTRKNS